MKEIKMQKNVSISPDKAKKSAKKFGGIREFALLCSVRMSSEGAKRQCRLLS